MCWNKKDKILSERCKNYIITEFLLLDIEEYSFLILFFSLFPVTLSILFFLNYFALIALSVIITLPISCKQRETTFDIARLEVQ